jgi:predicted CXXCH cytochrome family protein
MHALGAGASAVAEDPYAAQPQPMTVAECGRCHPIQFGSLREAGGGHRVDCRDCHQVFHAYNPRRGNYAEIMPRCEGCHDVPHGKEQRDCLSCHGNAHAPRQGLVMSKLIGVCGRCHEGPAQQLKQFPSAHSEQACQDCHSDRHGRIPECSECHEPHFQGQAMTGCTECHPVHNPRSPALPVDAAPQVCAACHKAVYENWSGTTSRHGKVACAVCHTQHGAVPACTDCHQPPHDPKMMARFNGCLGCHLDAHNLPTK